MMGALMSLTIALAMGATGQEAVTYGPAVGEWDGATAYPYPGDGAETVPYYYPYQWKQKHAQPRYILPPGPGDGWGFPNKNPDGYGWADYGPYLPLAADRTPEYYFPRYFSAPPEQMFLPAYYNPFTTRGQRYLPYAGGGGAHPAGGPPQGPSDWPVSPYASEDGRTPVTPVPNFRGRVEADPIRSGDSGLTP